MGKKSWKLFPWLSEGFEKLIKVEFYILNSANISLWILLIKIENVTLFFRPLVQSKYTPGYAMFSNLGLNNYTFYITSENQVGTAYNASKVFVPRQHDSKSRFAFSTVPKKTLSIKSKNVKPFLCIIVSTHFNWNFLLYCYDGTGLIWIDFDHLKI